MGKTMPLSLAISPQASLHPQSAPICEPCRTEKVSGQAADTQEVQHSPNGKTLTMTMHLPSQNKPKVFVFSRG
jgi:hypothetical protein